MTGMLKGRGGILVVATAMALSAGAARANTESLELSVTELQAARRSHSHPQRATASYDGEHITHWLASGGLGVNIDPSGLLATAQLEYVHKPWIFYGPFADMIVISGSYVLTAGITVRTLLGGVLRPSFEAGVGFTFANSTAGSLGFHFHFGVGLDYRIRPGITLGTMLRPTFNPPIDNFWISWPLVIGRFAL